MVNSEFDGSTRQMLQRLSLSNAKTLFRRRTDFCEKNRANVNQFLKPGVHFRRLSPDSKNLIWNMDLTERDWNEACGYD